MSNYDDTHYHPEVLAEMEALRQLDDDDFRAAVVESYGGQPVPDLLINRSDETILNVAVFRVLKRGGVSTPHDFDAARRPSALVEWWDRLSDDQRGVATTMTPGSSITAQQLVLMGRTQFPISLWTIEQPEPGVFLVPDDVAQFITDRVHSSTTES